MYLHALVLGGPPLLPSHEMDRVQEQMRRMSYGKAPDFDDVQDTPRLRAG